MRLLIAILLLTGGLKAQAPNLEFVSNNGVTEQLSDYSGQVVYLSFWASWCKPCIQNFEKYEPMRDQLEKAGVKLVNISIDKNKDKWESALEKYSFITGHNGLATDIDKSKTTFGITKTPDYHIINKDGQFVFLSDDANRNIVKEFEAWLKE